MKILKKQKGKMWVNETKRMVRYSVYYNEVKYPNTPEEWRLESEVDALMMEANWQLEDEQRLKELEAGGDAESPVTAPATNNG